MQSPAAHFTNWGRTTQRVTSLDYTVLFSLICLKGLRSIEDTSLCALRHVWTPHYVDGAVHMRFLSPPLYGAFSRQSHRYFSRNLKVGKPSKITSASSLALILAYRVEVAIPSATTSSWIITAAAIRLAASSTNGTSPALTQ
jgi:hypothetical protein